MADYFETLSTTGTGTPTLIKSPIRVLKATGVSVPKLVKLVSRTYGVVAVTVPKAVRSLGRSLISTATAVVTKVSNEIRPKMAPKGVLDSKWSATSEFGYDSTFGIRYDGTLEAPIEFS